MPADPAVLSDLDMRGIQYEEMACDPDLADTAQFCEAYGIPLERSANAILVSSRKPEGHHVICLVLATTRLDVNGKVRRDLGVRKASFAQADATKELTGQEIGGVTVFGIPDDVPIWIDSRVLDHDWVIVGAGTRSAKIKVDPQVFDDDPRFDVVEDLAKELAP